MTRVQHGLERSSIVDLSSDEAREFLLRHDSYCTFDLPQYFNFDCLISKVGQILKSKDQTSNW